MWESALEEICPKSDQRQPRACAHLRGTVKPHHDEMKHAKLSNPVHVYLLSVYALTSFFSLLCTMSFFLFWFPLRFCVAPARI